MRWKENKRTRKREGSATQGELHILNQRQER